MELLKAGASCGGGCNGGETGLKPSSPCKFSWTETVTVARLSARSTVCIPSVFPLKGKGTQF